MIRSGAGAAAFAVAIVAACTPIESVPLTSAPTNTCPCEGFAPGARVAPRCRNRRCEIPTPANRPEFPFFVVVDIPTSSIYAPGATFTFFADERGDPAFEPNRTTPQPGTIRRCIRPSCLSLGEMTVATGNYRVSAALSLRAGFPLEEGASIPVRVAYVQTGSAQFPGDTPAAVALFAGLPLAPIYAFPRVVLDGNPPREVAGFAHPLPSGSYLRVLYPEPPFDALFPPRADPEQPITSSAFFDAFFLAEVDPEDKRQFDVERDAGLDGWQVWLADATSKRRISVVKTLSGTTAKVRLDTSGQLRTAAGGLGDDVEAVLAPPPGYIGVPSYASPSLGGSFGTLTYPAIPPPVPVNGNVAEPTANEGDPLLGYAASLTFESTDILKQNETGPSLLHYSTVVSTDARGFFATVLPPGTYTVTIEPAEGTGFAKLSRQGVVVDPKIEGSTALRLQPPRRTFVRGRALLTDNQPLAEAEILATPQPTTTSGLPKPRPGRTSTRADGRFAFELDQGPYVITVIPKKGSGFPRVVTLPQIPVGEADLPDIRVPAPTPLSFTLRDPTRVENVVPNARVRIFAVPGVSKATELATLSPADTGAAPVEIGSAVSDANGLVEILLAPGPR